MRSHRLLRSFRNLLHDALHIAANRAFLENMPVVYGDHPPRLHGVINIEEGDLRRLLLQSGAPLFSGTGLDQPGATKREEKPPDHYRVRVYARRNGARIDGAADAGQHRQDVDCERELLVNHIRTVSVFVTNSRHEST